MKSSQSALEPLELDELELRLLPELELSLSNSRGGVVSATADRSARAMKRSLFMAAMVVRGFSWRSCESGREKAREPFERGTVKQDEVHYLGSKWRLQTAR